MSTFGDEQSQRLAQALQRLLVKSGMSGSELARKLGFSQPKVSKMANGRQRVLVAEADAWAVATNATTEEREEVRQLAEAALVAATAWRNVSAVADNTSQRVVGQFEQEARRFRVFQPVIIPGLLQTPLYGRQIFLTWSSEPPSEERTAAWLADRLARQAILYREDKQFEFLLPEAALRWRFGPLNTTLGQLDRIGEVPNLPNVKIGIIPQDAEASVWHTHGFQLFDKRDGELHVQVETLTTALNITDPADVARFEQAFSALQAIAVFGGEARALLQSIATDLRRLAGPDGEVGS